MTNQPQPAKLLQDYLPQVLAAAKKGPILDLACGTGQNGLLCLQAGASVVFADRSEQQLDKCRQAIQQLPVEMQQRATLWLIDFEQPDQSPLAGKQFGAILVFRYLHRPLIPAIREALLPGGVLVYETFTVENRQFGRPNRAEFLLNLGELEEWFGDWQVLFGEDVVEKEPVERAVGRVVVERV